MSKSNAVTTPCVPHCRFRDIRLEKRSLQLFEALAKQPNATLKQLASGCAKKAAFSRFLHNPNTHIDRLTRGIEQDTHERLMAARYEHVLIVSDTTEINLHQQRGYHCGRGLGVTGNNVDLGFFIHQGVAVSPETGGLLGCTSLKVWTRKGGCQDRSGRESEKWFEVVRNSVQVAQPLATQYTFINDREGDIFSLWKEVSESGHNLLTRAKQDRRIAVTEACPTGKLFTDLQQQPMRASFEFSIPADRETGRLARKSLMEVRWVDVELLEPRQQRKSAERVPLYAIEVREQETCVPAGQKPLAWILLTTHFVGSFDDAMQMVVWYLYRWRVEDVFSALKTRGIDLEGTTVEDGEAIIKLGVMAVWSANRMTALVKGRQDEVTDASEFFPEEELACMEELCPKLEGKTAKQRNPYRPRSLAWAVWVIARLGRWHSNGQPGLQTIRRGLERFEAAYFGWTLSLRL